jgi:hypothetical protein
MSLSLETLVPENKVHDEKVMLILAFIVPESIITTLNKIAYKSSGDYISHSYHISPSNFIPTYYCSLVEEVTGPYMAGNINVLLTNKLY